jgi:hypothetical protein
MNSRENEHWFTFTHRHAQDIVREEIYQLLIHTVAGWLRNLGCLRTLLRYSARICYEKRIEKILKRILFETYTTFSNDIIIHKYHSIISCWKTWIAIFLIWNSRKYTNMITNRRDLSTYLLKSFIDLFVSASTNWTNALCNSWKCR